MTNSVYVIVLKAGDEMQTLRVMLAKYMQHLADINLAIPYVNGCTCST
jgi:hypothetical protein